MTVRYHLDVSNPPPTDGSIMLSSFEFASIPLIYPNGSRPDQQYLWSHYPFGDIYTGIEEPGVAELISSDSVHGSKSLKVTVDTTGLQQSVGGAAYFLFFPYTYSGGSIWYFMYEIVEDYLQIATWELDTYNRMEFYCKVPSDYSPPTNSGYRGGLIGTYCRNQSEPVANQESNGLHFYHYFNCVPGTWTKVIMDWHPSHIRDADPGADQGIRQYPTSESGRNYFDTLTKMYIDFEYSSQPTTPSDFYIDAIRLYTEPDTEEMTYVYTISGGYNSGTNTLYVSWNKEKSTTTSFELVYAFSNIHTLGWNNATSAPSSPVAPSDAASTGGYSTVDWSTSSIDMGSNTSIFVAVRLVGQTLFKQIEVPLNL